MSQSAKLRQTYEFFKAYFLMSFPTVNPCTKMEKTTTIYVMTKKSSRSILAVKLRANAIEIPPLKPPQVTINPVFGTKSNFFEYSFTGRIKERYLAISNRGIAINPAAI